MMLSCAEVNERLVAWQDRELAPGEQVLVGDHLDRCERCRVRERRLARATPGPMPRLSPEAQAKLWHRLDAGLAEAARAPALPAAAPPWRWPRPTAAQLGYAAALLAALGWGWFNHVNAKQLQAALATERARHVPAAIIPGEQFRPVSYAPGSAAAPTSPAASEGQAFGHHQNQAASESNEPR
jgi:hypothetical protein